MAVTRLFETQGSAAVRAAEPADIATSEVTDAPQRSGERRAVRATAVGRAVGRYQLLHMLASGGMGSVYVARVIGLAGFERLVAVKLLHPHLAAEPAFVSMFLDEARIAARMRHPNVVATLDVGRDEESGYYLVMDYVEGLHLGALLRTQHEHRLPARIALRLVLDALEGLGAAHDLEELDGEPFGLVHRDVSPQNVLVGVDGVARVTDFGIAKGEHRMTTTFTGQLKGKLAYMSPEQAASGACDRRSDLYSLGIVLWEALTGRRLFRGATAAETMSRVLEGNAPLVSSVRPELSALDRTVARALAVAPEDRFPCAEAMRDALENAVPPDRIASTREVESFVRAHADTKIALETLSIRRATARASGSHDVGAACLEEEPTLAQPLAQPPAPASHRRRAHLAIVAVTLAALASVGFVSVRATLETQALHKSELATRVDPPVAPVVEAPAAKAAATVQTAVEARPRRLRARPSPSRARPGRLDVLDNPYRRAARSGT